MMIKRIQWIDAFRGYGAILVLLVHLVQAMQRNGLVSGNNIFNYMLNGARAVQLFFIISGFTTFLSLDSHKTLGGVYI